MSKRVQELREWRDAMRGLIGSESGCTDNYCQSCNGWDDADALLRGLDDIQASHDRLLWLLDAEPVRD